MQHIDVVPQPTSTSPSDHSSLNRAEPYVRRSTRTKAPPAWLKDYVCPQTTTNNPIDHSTPHSITSTPAQSSLSHSFHSISSHPLFLSSHMAHLSQNYVASLVSVLQKPERKYYSQAKQYPEWEMAMNHEVAALEQNHIWVLTCLPPGKKALTSKWMYKTKYLSLIHI